MISMVKTILFAKAGSFVSFFSKKISPVSLLLFGKAEYRPKGGSHAQERKEQEQPGRCTEETIQALAHKDTDEYQYRHRYANMGEVGQGTQKITVYW